MRTVALLSALALPTAAQEFVEVSGPLPDDAFYRAVACAAPPGGPCAKPFLRWPADRRDPLRVGFATVDDAVSPERRALFDAALNAAIAEVDRAGGGGLRMVRDDDAPDVGVHILATPPYRMIEGTDVPALDGARLEFGRVALTARRDVVVDGVVALTMHLPADKIASVMLEEVTQATGLLTDITGAAYASSVFAETGNAATALRGQDAMAVRRHYEETP